MNYLQTKLFIDYSTEGEFDEDIIGYDLLDRIKSRDLETRSEALEKMLNILKNDIEYDRNTYHYNYQTILNSINSNPYKDIKEKFIQFKNSIQDVSNYYYYK